MNLSQVKPTYQKHVTHAEKLAQVKMLYQAFYPSLNFPQVNFVIPQPCLSNIVSYKPTLDHADLSYSVPIHAKTHRTRSRDKLIHVLMLSQKIWDSSHSTHLSAASTHQSSTSKHQASMTPQGQCLRLHIVAHFGPPLALMDLSSGAPIEIKRTLQRRKGQSYISPCSDTLPNDVETYPNLSFP